MGFSLISRRIELAVGLRACPQEIEPVNPETRLPPFTNFGEIEPLPGDDGFGLAAQSSRRQDGLLSRVDIEAVDQILCAERLMYDLPCQQKNPAL